MHICLILDSPDPRSPRPDHVKYRVGQVIKHKVWGYRGIIVGWDEQARVILFFEIMHNIFWKY